MSTNNEMQIRRSTTARPPANPSAPSSSPTSPTEPKKSEPVLYNEMAVRFNENSLEQCRTSVSAVAGCVAGILGLTSYKGFLFYAMSMILLSLLIYFRIRNEYRLFFNNSRHIFINGFLNGLLTFVLFWTFVYGMVHVY